MTRTMTSRRVPAPMSNADPRMFSLGLPWTCVGCGTVFVPAWGGGWAHWLPEVQFGSVLLCTQCVQHIAAWLLQACGLHDSAGRSRAAPTSAVQMQE